ncbi:oligopeptide transport system substrate-binding protein [Prosthecobacter debontii]|uniref:Oligopeptide transport system substrate-binding protein n=1 Tax=Prosthecobacter debontii TaxID=48467 RepID=A0A1T4WS39_9BACT|nr:peptide ABC transporter substrate-binding protein [Prosthecobacter debontii]SKA80192.1 oligopeptide transport system substrate-binding protein [Prosthecobacter debontii]
MRWLLRIIVLAGLGLGLMAFHQTRTHRPTRVAEATEKGILILGNGSEPETMDLHLATGTPEHHIFDSLFEGLVAASVENPDGNTPGAASRWETADFITWTFYLRPEGKWSDGVPVTAEDFLFSFQRILSPELAAPYAPMLYPMRNAEKFNKGELKDFTQVGVKVIDDHTLQIVLEGPAPYLPSMLKHYSWHPVPRHVIERFGKMTDRDTKWTRVGNLVGNGPFQLKEWRYTHSLTVERNPHYWDAKTVKLNGIEFIPIVSDATEERAFRDGQIHQTQTIPLPKLDYYRQQKPELFHEDPLLGTYFYRLNVTKPPFNDKRVRRALTLAVDRETLIRNVLRAGQKPALGFTPPGAGEGYTTPMPLKFDPEEARRLLAEAGFPNGKGFPKFDILINTMESHRTIAEAIQEMWKKHLNIPAGVLNQDWGVYLENQRKLDYQVCRAGWIGDYLDPYTFLSIWQTGDGNNNTGWGLPRYDALMQASLREGDATRRMAILSEAENLLLDELPMVPIYWYVRNYLSRPEVRGMKPSLLEHRCYKAVWLEGAPAARE